MWVEHIFYIVRKFTELLLSNIRLLLLEPLKQLQIVLKNEWTYQE